MLQDGGKIYTIRKEKKGLTQTEMADYLGITQSSYCRIERETIDVNLETIQKIAKKLQTDPKNIINNKEVEKMQEVFTQNIENNFGSANSGTFNYNNDLEVIEVIQNICKTFENLQGSFSVLLEKLAK